MRKFFTRGVVAVLLTSLTLTPVAMAQQAEPTLCTPSGFSLGFFNGVWNTPIEADSGAASLGVLVGTKHLAADTGQQEDIKTTTFYNTTGASAAATKMQDVAEVFQQRSRDINLDLSNRWELFWDIVHNDRSSAWDIMREVPGALTMANDLFEAVRAKEAAALASLASSPPTASDMAKHVTKIKGLITERKKLVWVAHSQGNLFMNRAYEAALTVATTDGSTVTGANVKAVHIAPASTTLKGQHTLADIDLVINALRITPGAVPPVNLLILPSLADVSGHMLVETYLDGTRGGRETVKGLIMPALDSVVAPKTNGATGFFTVTMTWDGGGDVDLHTFEPTGAHVYYSNKRGAIGNLDTDNTSAVGPEHYTASCSPDVVKAGTYRVGINNYARATGRTATVQVSTANEGEIFTTSLGVGTEKGSGGNSSPIQVVNIQVAQDATGKLKATIAR